MNKENFKANKYTYMRTIIVLVLISLPFMASDCVNNILSGGNTGDVSGTWQLTEIQGNLQDVCLGEVATFPSMTSGTATLTCPNGSPLSRLYTVSNLVLTYTETGVSYDINSDGSTLTLTGANSLGRTLIYGKISANKTAASEKTNSANKNSSDK